MISRTEEYALRAVVHLARQRRLLRAAELAAATGIPGNYLAKILHELARSGVVESERGRGGGFRLAGDPARLRLAEVIGPFAPPRSRERCLLGRPECSEENPCGAHERWKGIKEATSEFFRTTSVADVLEVEDPSSAR